MESIFFVAMMCGLLGAILFLVTNSQNRKELIAALHSLEGFQSSQQFVSANTGIAIDDDHRTICLISRSPVITTRIVPYADILSSEIVEDGISVTRSSRTSQAAGMILGGILGGGIGAVVGSLTGARVTRARVNRIELRVIINDLQNPIHEVNFLDAPAKQGSMVYIPSRKAAEHWHALFDVIIRRADDEAVNTKPSSPRNTSVADELTKLADLRDRGILTSEEFDQQKQMALRQGSGNINALKPDVIFNVNP